MLLKITIQNFVLLHFTGNKFWEKLFNKWAWAVVKNKKESDRERKNTPY